MIISSDSGQWAVHIGEWWWWVDDHLITLIDWLCPLPPFAEPSTGARHNRLGTIDCLLTSLAECRSYHRTQSEWQVLEYFAAPIPSPNWIHFTCESHIYLLSFSASSFSFVRPVSNHNRNKIVKMNWKCFGGRRWRQPKGGGEDSLARVDMNGEVNNDHNLITTPRSIDWPKTMPTTLDDLA